MTDTVVVRAVSTDLAYYISNYPGMIGLTDSSTLLNLVLNAISSYVTSKTPGVDIPLSAVAVDFEANKAEMLSILTANPVWSETVTAATGEILIEMIATALTYMQFNIVRSAQETMFDTARIDSSIFAGTRHLGVRIARRIPSKCQVNLTRTGDLSSSLEILPYSQFNTSSNTNNFNLFNRNTIIFPANTATVTIYLFAGQVGNVTTVISNGQPFQTYYLGNGNFAISDVDVQCTVDGITWQRTSYQDYFNIGMWEYDPTSTVFSDDSTADGNVEIRFGNGRYGKIPPTNSKITFTYVLCNGEEDNVNVTNSTISAAFANNITGIVNSPNTGGTNALAASDYRNLSPGLYSAKYRPSTRAQEAATARRWPGVIDAIFEGQAELAPSDLRQMLLCRATLLTNTVWSNDDFNEFKAWFQNLCIANLVIYQHVPTPIPIDINATVYCKDSAALSSLQTKINSNLVNAFQIGPGVLGYKRTLSDIGDIIKRTDRALIDYYDILSPTSDISVNNDQYIVLGNVTLNMAYTTRKSF